MTGRHRPVSGVRRRRVAITAVVAVHSWVMIGVAGAQPSPPPAPDPVPDACADVLHADLVPAGYDPVSRDWTVGTVRVADVEQACEDQTPVRAWLLDAAGQTLAVGVGELRDGAADVEMTLGEAPVAVIDELRLDLPGPGDDPDLPGPEVDDTDDDTEVLGSTERRPEQLAGGSEVRDSIQRASDRLPTTGADLMLLAAVGAAATVLGRQLIARRRGGSPG